MSEPPERAPWLEQLEPPADGLASLRRRLARHERWRRARRAGALAGPLLLALALLLGWLRAPDRSVPLAIGDDLLAMRFGLLQPPDEPVSVPAELRREMALQRVATGDERVVYYRVGRIQK